MCVVEDVNSLNIYSPRQIKVSASMEDRELLCLVSMLSFAAMPQTRRGAAWRTYDTLIVYRAAANGKEHTQRAVTLFDKPLQMQISDTNTTCVTQNNAADKLYICMGACVRAHNAHIRARAMN